MCGIAGIVGQQASPQRVSQMCLEQSHRGPDGQGIWGADGVQLGHLRLSILDLSPAGAQPMISAGGRFIIVYNGEVYNYAELRRSLEPEFNFHSDSDTEVVLNAYTKWGRNCLDRFIGMFSFAIWDNEKRELFCARDRLGIKPFYYARFRDSFLFASEIMPLLAAGFPAEINNRMLYDFLAYELYEHSEETFFAGIQKLPPAGWMCIKDGCISEHGTYWSLPEAMAGVSISDNPQHRIETLQMLMEDAVKLHLRSDVPVGIALSGGLDSTILLQQVDRCHANPAAIQAFSFVTDDPRYSEQPHIEEMLRHSGHQGYFDTLSPARFAELAEQGNEEQQEPFAGVPITAYAQCYQNARQRGVIVMMDGSGLDEAFAGYTRFAPAYWADLAATGNMVALEREWSANGIITTDDKARAREMMRRAASTDGGVALAQDLTASARADCLSDDFAAHAFAPPPNFERPFDDALHNLMYRDLRYTKIPRALRFRDRLSMAASTELRPPFLDHRLLAYAFSLPATDLISNGEHKSILRRMSTGMLPDNLRLAQKRSVQTPQREWFRNDLREWVRSRIEDSRFLQRGWVDAHRARAAMNEFLDGQGDNSFFLWQWINLEMWASRFIDRQPALLSKSIS